MLRSLGIVVALSAPVAADVIELDGERGELANGTLSISGKRTAKLAVGGGTKLATARFRATTMIVVSSATEAVVAAADDGKPWRIAGRFPIGGVGLDGDYAYAIDATPAGLVRYQTVAGARRCDGKPAYLFAEIFDPASGKLAKVVPPSGIDPAAASLAARLDRDPASAPLVVRARLASAQGASDAGGLAIPTELDDGSPATVWQENVGGNGRGHWITFEGRAAATQVRIVPGNPKSPEALRANHRPKRLGIATADGAWWVELPDPVATKEPLGAAYAIDLPRPAMNGCVTIVLDATHAGASGDTTAIAELQVFVANERGAGGGEAVLAKLVADGADGATGAAQALARRGAAGVTAIVDALAKTPDPVAKHRLVLALAVNRDPAAAPALVAAAADTGLGPAELHTVIDALGSLGQVTALAALAKQMRIAVELRALAASRIDATKPDGMTALVGIAGTEPTELRRAVIDALAHAPLPQLLEAASSAEGASPDLVRALTKAARTSKDLALRAQIVDALVTGLPAASDYEHRYRVIDAIATLGDRVALAKLERALQELPASTEGAALRQVAIRAVMQAPRVEVMPLVIGLAGDRDPGVRLAAIGALASSDAEPGGPWHAPDGPDAIDRVIITALSTDRWPEVRRRAAESLGTRCTRPGPAAALTDRLMKDREPGVRVGSLAALVQCKAAGITETLAKLWDDGKSPIGLRTAAIDQTIILGDPALAAQLVGKLAAWRAAAIESKEALELAQHAAVALGRLGPPGAAAALIAALEDSAYPEIVSAAALGLGALGPACPASAKATLLQLAKDEENLATVAKRAAAQCSGR